MNQELVGLEARSGLWARGVTRRRWSHEPVAIRAVMLSMAFSGFGAHCAHRGGFSSKVFPLPGVHGKSIEWNCDLWLASLDPKKVLHRIEHNATFTALARQRVPQSCVQLLKTM